MSTVVTRRELSTHPSVELTSYLSTHGRQFSGLFALVFFVFCGVVLFHFFLFVLFMFVSCFCACFLPFRPFSCTNYFESTRKKRARKKLLGRRQHRVESSKDGDLTLIVLHLNILHCPGARGDDSAGRDNPTEDSKKDRINSVGRVARGYFRTSRNTGSRKDKRFSKVRSRQLSGVKRQGDVLCTFCRSCLLISWGSTPDSVAFSGFFIFFLG